MTSYYSLRAGLVAGVALMTLAACSSAPQTVSGECRQVFGGDVCTWATMNNGAATEFGATVPMSTLENAPMDVPMVFPPVANAIIPLPAEATNATGFSHLSVYWELHGHPPALYMTPHFDFHFYTTDPAKVAAIDCTDTTKPAALPAGYTLPDIEIPGMGTLVGLCVPGMGMHAVPTAELDQTDPFSATMIVGYYGGELTLIEPMIARAKLMESQTFQMTVPPTPPGTPSTVHWPARFEAVYDAATRAYRFVFSMSGN